VRLQSAALRADTRPVTAATRSEPDAAERGVPERAWGREEFEALSEEEVVEVLLRRLRRLVARGLEPTEALVIASRVELPVA